MTWQKKAAAPAIIDVASAFAALITGDATWGWLLEWIPFLPNDQVDVAAMCALGPPVAVPPLSASEFFAGARSNPISWLVQKVALIFHLQQIAADRVFAAYCENVVASGACNDIGILTELDNGNFQGPGTEGPLHFIHLPIGSTGLHLTNIPPGAGTINVHYFVDGVYAALLSSGGPVWPPTHDMQVNFPRQADLRVTLVVVSPNQIAGTVINACIDGDGTPIDHLPTPQPEPTGVLSPIPYKTYATIPELGAELDRLEAKCDFIVSALTFVAHNLVLPGAPDAGVPASSAEDAPLVEPKAVGYRIDVSVIPSGAIVHFGTPQAFVKVGRYTLGSANGWLPSVEISHTPFLVQPLPVGVDRIQTTMHAPATALVTPLFTPK